MMGRIKLVLVGMAILLIVVIVLQNTDTVETKLLFFSMTMPRAALLFGAMAIGFTAGVLVTNRLALRSRVKDNPDKASE
jgi:uncharacterized integral membrane protein